jgi:hypothetical protein
MLRPAFDPRRGLPLATLMDPPIAKVMGRRQRRGRRSRRRRGWGRRPEPSPRRSSAEPRTRPMTASIAAQRTPSQPAGVAPVIRPSRPRRPIGTSWNDSSSRSVSSSSRHRRATSSTRVRAAQAARFYVTTGPTTRSSSAAPETVTGNTSPSVTRRQWDHRGLHPASGPKNLGEFRQELRERRTSARPPQVPAAHRLVEPYNKDRARVALELAQARVVSTHAYLIDARSLDPRTLNDERFRATWKQATGSHRNVLFPASEPG